MTSQNRLASETSPYLLQHADNPVAWYPWGDEAIARARNEDKPILLSIGYSACHWCHVMAHESFEDDEVAALMNRLFVNIKVDREERPDLDRVYQTAHQYLTQRPGGWPLTMFLAPEDVTPFFGGTYFPRERRYGMPAFVDVLQQVAAWFKQHRMELKRQNTALRDALQRMGSDATTPSVPDAALSDAAFQALASEFDPVDGGFGHAPKFPHASSLELLLRTATDPQRAATERTRAREMLTLSLTRMAHGGIFDQLGGGFYRYSVDASWQIPHFEKMLYDNASLLSIYAQAWKLTGISMFRDVAEAVANWALREMRAPEGGFHASLDADSAGQEGAFYVWNRDAVRHLLDDTEYQLVAAHYGLQEPPNFEGRWHLHVSAAIAQLANDTGQDAETVEHRLASAKAKLMAARASRPRPGCDDKQLTGWNALMVHALALAGRLLERNDFVEAATASLDFLHRNLYADGRLMMSFKDGQALLPACLDEHAYLLQAELAVLETVWDEAIVTRARQLADTLLTHFQDTERGGFWFTADDQERLIYRPKVFSDESMPSGNGIAALALLRLGHLLGEPRYLEAAAHTLRAATAMIRQYPAAHASMIVALGEYLRPPEMILLRGGTPEIATAWQRAVDRRFRPDRICVKVPNNTRTTAALAAGSAPREGICAVLCRGTECSPPVGSLAALLDALMG